MGTIIDGGEACVEIQQVGRYDYSISIRPGAGGPGAGGPGAGGAGVAATGTDARVGPWYRLGRARAERKASLELLRYVRRREWDAGPVVVYRAGF